MRYTSRWIAAVALVALPVSGASLTACATDTVAGSSPTGAEASASSTGSTTATPAPATSGPSGGAGEPSSTGGPTTGPASYGKVTVARTGGIAGVMQVVVVNQDGSWVYTDKKAARTMRGRLTEALHRQLAALLANPNFVRETRLAPTPARCNDAFIYSVSVGEASVRYEQCGGVGNRPAIDAVLELVQGATPM